jgi:hypothetical protein
VRVFVSYAHADGDWVLDRLVPCLEAGGAEVLIDRERFKAGKAVIGQMDGLQDKAHRHVLAITSAYLASPYCQHELNRALACDPTFDKGIILPVKREDVTLPAPIPNALYVDLRNDKAPDPWQLLLDGCGTDLGVTAPEWLSARDQARRYLGRRQSVNLVTRDGAQWRPMLQQIADSGPRQMAIIDMQNPATISRRGLVAEILGALGINRPVPDEDLAELGRGLGSLGTSRLALSHFDLAYHRWREDVDLFASLRYFIMETRSLVLLVQSRAPFETFLPPNHPLSKIDIKTVELR